MGQAPGPLKHASDQSAVDFGTKLAQGPLPAAPAAPKPAPVAPTMANKLTNTTPQAQTVNTGAQGLGNVSVPAGHNTQPNTPLPQPGIWGAKGSSPNLQDPAVYQEWLNRPETQRSLISQAGPYPGHVNNPNRRDVLGQYPSQPKRPTYNPSTGEKWQNVLGLGPGGGNISAGSSLTDEQMNTLSKLDSGYGKSQQIGDYNNDMRYWNNYLSKMDEYNEYAPKRDAYDRASKLEAGMSYEDKLNAFRDQQAKMQSYKTKLQSLRDEQAGNSMTKMNAAVKFGSKMAMNIQPNMQN